MTYKSLRDVDMAWQHDSWLDATALDDLEDLDLDDFEDDDDEGPGGGAGPTASMTPRVPSCYIHAAAPPVYTWSLCA